LKIIYLNYKGLQCVLPVSL